MFPEDFAGIKDSFEENDLIFHKEEDLTKYIRSEPQELNDQ